MDEFLNNNLPEEEDEQEVSPNAEEKDFEPIYNPVNYTEVKPIEDYKPMSRGLKLFALILAAVILLTGTCLTGYLLGRNSVKISHPKVEVNLAAKPSDTDEMTEAEVYEEVNKSIVGIVAYNTSRKASQASGIVFSKEGYIVTNDHIYSDIAAAKFKIYTYDGKEYDAEYVAGDTVSDLAVLKVKGASLTPAKFGNSDDLFYGEHVVAIGRPNDATDASSITRGIVSAVNRRVQTTSNYSSRLIQTDSAINPGSSGGALVNMFGQVIGVTSSKLASVEYDAVGYAIPTTTMKRIVDELISNGKVVSRAKLGITYATIDSITAEMNGYDYKGILIDSVSEDSGLYGKAEKGDVITHINGIEITNDNIVLDIIENSRAGDKITVTIATNSGTVKTVEAKLSANIGESSYKAIEEKPEINKDGAFNFPEGE
jgi:serine protease Do